MNPKHLGSTLESLSKETGRLEQVRRLARKGRAPRVWQHRDDGAVVRVVLAVPPRVRRREP